MSPFFKDVGIQSSIVLVRLVFPCDRRFDRSAHVLTIAYGSVSAVSCVARVLVYDQVWTCVSH